MNKLTSFIVISGLAISLTACSKTREQFDFSKKAPDEFAIVTRAPLEMPKTLDLPPPRPGMARPQEVNPETKAKQTLFGAEQKQDTSLSSGEAILLQKAQANKSSDNIRATIDAETKEVIKENTSTFDKLMGRVGKKTDVPSTVVDPIKENERIIQNKKAGKPITDGKTPSIEE